MQVVSWQKSADCSDSEDRVWQIFTVILNSYQDRLFVSRWIRKPWYWVIAQVDRNEESEHALDYSIVGYQHL
jgi:hypothetical protein